MPIEFGAIDTRLNRADRHGAELGATICEFRDGSPPPYEVIQEPDPGGGVLWRLRIVRPLPAMELAAIAGEVAHSLRAALDYLAEEIVARLVSVLSLTACDSRTGRRLYVSRT